MASEHFTYELSYLKLTENNVIENTLNSKTNYIAEPNYL